MGDKACAARQGDGASYTVKQVAEMAGVSIRALHHYESLGLLVPKRRENGYRAYESTDLARLQQILVFRECGLPLADIEELLDDAAYDAKVALEHHLAMLAQRKRELETLMDTVEKTIDELEGKTTMTDEERFEGLKRAAVDENEEAFGSEARERYGDAAVDAANEKLLAMDEGEWSDMNELERAIVEKLRAAMATGDARGEAARELAGMHARWIEMHWGAGAYSPEAHRMLAQGYLADDRFRDYYDSRAGEGATEFLVQVLEAWL